MSATAVELEALVIEALRKAISQEGDSRLAKKGKADGLLPAGASAAVKAARAQCLDPDLGLFEIRTATEGKGKSAAEVQYLRPSPWGIGALLAHSRPEDRAELLADASPDHAGPLKAAILHALPAELAALDARRRALHRAEAESLALAARLIEERQAALADEGRELERKRADLQRLEGACKPAVVANTDKGYDDRPKISVPEPETKPDNVYQPVGDILEGMVFTWEDEPELRPALEPLMMNSGLSPIGEVGQIVEFDGRFHQTEADLQPGDTAVVAAPGWEYTSPGGLKRGVNKPRVEAVP